MRAAALLSLLAVVAAAAAEPSGFTVGVLRRDGVVIPFATYDGKRWSPRWPPPDREPEIPINLRSVPSKWWGPAGLRDAWQTWIESRPGATIHALRPDVVDAHCVKQVGLRTDYQSSQPPAPPTEQPYPKDGLVVSPPQTDRGAGAPGASIEPIEIIEPGAPQLTGFAGVLHDAFDKAERVTAGGFHHPVPQDVRERIAPKIEAVYAFGQAPRIYYVEAIREYGFLASYDHWPFDDAPTCGAAYGSGWLARDEKGFHAIDVSVRIVRCDRYGSTYMLPFGAMHLGGKVYWIAQFSGWDHERYVVVDVSSKAVEAVVNAWGGGC
jgi:hypothetical protein